MADQEDEDLQMALKMSMSTSPPEPKRSKPREDESPEAKNRRAQRELMAKAAERRMMTVMRASQQQPQPSSMAASAAAVPSGSVTVPISGAAATEDVAMRRENSGEELSVHEANQLFSMVFGSSVSKEILAQWTNQGIRFSPDPETCMGLVQHEGGPCGVLAAIQREGNLVLMQAQEQAKFKELTEELV